MCESEIAVAFSILGWPRKFEIYHSDALAQNNTAFTVVLAMTFFVCKLARAAVLASYDLIN